MIALRSVVPGNLCDMYAKPRVRQNDDANAKRTTNGAHNLAYCYTSADSALHNVLSLVAPPATC